MIFNDIPEQQYAWRTAEIERLRTKLRDQTFVGSQGEIRWNSNPTSVIAPSTFRDAHVTPPASQQAAYDTNTAAFLAEYRESRKNYVPSAEEMFEMRAAHGPGVKLVDIITGQEFIT